MWSRRTVLCGLPLTLLPAACLSTRGPSVAHGAVAPHFELQSHDGRVVSLDDAVARGPAVLVFYRGHW